MSVNGRFVHACSEGDMEVFNSLISLADLNSEETGTTPLIAAIIGNHLEIIKRLLNHPGINVNRADKNSWTALHHACFQNRTQVVEVISRARGVNINVKEEVTGKTPLMVAVLGESLAVIAKMVRMDGIGLFLEDNNGDDIEELARYI
jgi:ankyrin repeat protein